jgi:hypothetical protein
MGRGGPPEPEIAEAGSVTVEGLLRLVREGHHAASDYLEDALTAGVTTIGARRAGGGLAGAPFASNVRAAAELAVERRAGIVILEGSGASIPPIPWDAGVLVVPASAPPEYLGGYLGPFRLLLSDLVVVTMATGPVTGHENLSALRAHVRRFLDDPRQIILTDFIPVPLEDVRGERVFFTTTAPEVVAARQVHHLEATDGCTVVGWSARLADRAGLAEDMEGAEGFDILLTELKAAAVDIGVERALARDHQPGAGQVAIPVGPAHPRLLDEDAETVLLAPGEHGLGFGIRVRRMIGIEEHVGRGGSRYQQVVRSPGNVGILGFHASRITRRKGGIGLRRPVVVTDPDMARPGLQCGQVFPMQPREKFPTVRIVEIVPFRLDCRIHA